jgi:hypothetical protein
MITITCREAQANTRAAKKAREKMLLELVREHSGCVSAEIVRACERGDEVLSYHVYVEAYGDDLFTGLKHELVHEGFKVTLNRARHTNDCLSFRVCWKNKNSDFSE